jgi:hypothetical protein
MKKITKDNLYYLIHWTWGFITSFIGLCVYIPSKLLGCKTYRYRKAICIVWPGSFGGCELGMFFVRGEHNESVCAHEYGHSIQTLVLGPLMLFIISIPSCIRYWYRKGYKKVTKQPCKTGYDDIWFEGQATKLGNMANEEKWSWL